MWYGWFQEEVGMYVRCTIVVLAGPSLALYRVRASFSLSIPVDISYYLGGAV